MTCQRWTAYFIAFHILLIPSLSLWLLPGIWLSFPFFSSMGIFLAVDALVYSDSNSLTWDVREKDNPVSEIFIVTIAVAIGVADMLNLMD